MYTLYVWHIDYNNISFQLLPCNNVVWNLQVICMSHLAEQVSYLSKHNKKDLPPWIWDVFFALNEIMFILMLQMNVQP